MASRTILDNDTLKEIYEKYISKEISDSALAKEYHIGLPRLRKEMETYVSREEKKEQKRQSKKGTPITDEEIIEIVELYTKDEWSMNKIAQHILRSPGAVRSALVKNGIPIRARSRKNAKTTVVGDKTSELREGDKIYSYLYNLYGEVTKTYKDNIFRVWLEQYNGGERTEGFFAHQKRHNLAKI